MVAQMVRGGGALEIPTADETAAAVDQRHRAFWHEQQAVQDARDREKLRGIKRMEYVVPVNSSGTTAFLGTSQIGPEEGYLWTLMLAGIILSSGGNNLIIYKASASGDTRRPLALIPAPTSGAAMVATWGKMQAVIRHGEGLYMVASGGTITSAYLAGEQVQGPMEAKLYE